ncbi:MAG: hypothetical protein V8Q27_05905 [Eubacteriales bacterium]
MDMKPDGYGPQGTNLITVSKQATSLMKKRTIIDRNCFGGN